MTNEEMLYLAKAVVKNHYDDNIRLDDIFVVWFCKTLQNWKALVSTNQRDGMYFEVTYNGDTDECYVDSYKKTQNQVFGSDYIDDVLSVLRGDLPW